LATGARFQRRGTSARKASRISGRRDIGQCGHEVTYVLPAFALCSVKGCDTKPGGCMRCGSRRLYPFAAPHLPDGTLACEDCGALRWSY
jgi:hypothetical protein